MRIVFWRITWNEIAGEKYDISLIDRTKYEQIYCVEGGECKR